MVTWLIGNGSRWLRFIQEWQKMNAEKKANDKSASTEADHEIRAAVREFRALVREVREDYARAKQAGGRIPPRNED